MSERIRFSCPLPPPGLRRNSETRKHAWRAQLKDQYSEAVWIAAQSGIYTIWRGDTWVAATLDAHLRTRRTVIASMQGERDVNPPWDKAHLALVWKHCGVAPDHDNALASCKVLIDTLHTKGRRPLGIVLNDSPDCLTVELATEKVARRADECVEVKIERRR